MSMRANSCLCCGDRLLRHVRYGEVYWFCHTCWQEFPLLTVNRLPKEGKNLAAVTQPPVKA